MWKEKSWISYEWVPENKWEGDYLVSIKRIKTKESVIYFALMLGIVIFACATYVGIIREAIPTLNNYVEYQRELMNNSVAAQFIYQCNSYEGYGCENHFINITGIYCNGTMVCQNKLKE